LPGWKNVVCEYLRIFFRRTLNNKISLAAMHKKEKLSEKVVLAEQSHNSGLVKNLEQLSHIAIVSFTGHYYLV
jgi:hypothetical protein